MREIAGRCMVTFPYTGKCRWTSLEAMSDMTLCNFIHLIPRMTSIPRPLRTIRLVLNTLPDNSSGTFWAIRLVSTRPPGALIMYDAPNATSVNLALSGHAELMKSCEAPESNNTMMGCSLRKNVPAKLPLPWVSHPRWCSWHGRTAVLGLSTDLPHVLEYEVSWLVLVGSIPW
jgi:hypothetical protein